LQAVASSTNELPHCNGNPAAQLDGNEDVDDHSYHRVGVVIGKKLQTRLVEVFGSSHSRPTLPTILKLNSFPILIVYTVVYLSVGVVATLAS
jgi:hypothetical protein